MPRISTDNYDTVASWNGSQDLFVVEQPDGTKVATPAMVKQFIEAGDFVATGEVKDGHGNILADMAKSDEIGDLSQTGLTGDSVAAQLTALKDIKCSVTTYNWNLGNVTADTVYTLSNFKSTVGLSGKSIIAVGFNFIAGSSDYDYGAETNYRNLADFVRVKVSKTQTNTTVNLYIIYTD